MKAKIVGAIIAVAVVAAGVYVAMSGTYVGQGEVGVVYTAKSGVKEKTLGPGFQFVGPQAKEQAKQDAEKAELDKQTAIAQGEANKAKAEADKAVTITNAEAEAESNRIVSQSITDELIRMKEAEARKEHGWVEVQGADTVVTEK